MNKGLHILSHLILHKTQSHTYFMDKETGTQKSSILDPCHVSDLLCREAELAPQLLQLKEIKRDCNVEFGNRSIGGA